MEDSEDDKTSDCMVPSRCRKRRCTAQNIRFFYNSTVPLFLALPVPTLSPSMRRSFTRHPCTFFPSSFSSPSLSSSSSPPSPRTHPSQTSKPQGRRSRGGIVDPVQHPEIQGQLADQSGRSRSRPAEITIKSHHHSLKE